MYSIDLHGMSHKDAKIEVEETLLASTTLGSFEFEFITGKSKEMRSIVVNICKEYEFSYYVPTDNQGKIVVTYFNL